MNAAVDRRLLGFGNRELAIRLFLNFDLLGVIKVNEILNYVTNFFGRYIFDGMHKGVLFDF